MGHDRTGGRGHFTKPSPLLPKQAAESRARGRGMRALRGSRAPRKAFISRSRIQYRRLLGRLARPAALGGNGSGRGGSSAPAPFSAPHHSLPLLFLDAPLVSPRALLRLVPLPTAAAASRAAPVAQGQRAGPARAPARAGARAPGEADLRVAAVASPLRARDVYRLAPPRQPKPTNRSLLVCPLPSPPTFTNSARKKTQPCLSHELQASYARR